MRISFHFMFNVCLAVALAACGRAARPATTPVTTAAPAYPIAVEIAGGPPGTSARVILQIECIGTTFEAREAVVFDSDGEAMLNASIPACEVGIPETQVGIVADWGHSGCDLIDEPAIFERGQFHLRAHLRCERIIGFATP